MIWPECQNSILESILLANILMDREREHFCFIAQTFSRRPEADDGRVCCYDLDELNDLAVACISGGRSDL